MGKRRIEEILDDCNRALNVSDMPHEQLIHISENLRLINDPKMDNAWKYGFIRGTLELIKNKLLEELEDGNRDD